MTREIKFRAWHKKHGMTYEDEPFVLNDFWGDSLIFGSPINDFNFGDFIFMQYTGLKDKNGVEIYEFMELDNRWEVDWNMGKYILRDISNNDIIDLDYENKYEITREYTKIQKDT